MERSRRREADFEAKRLAEPERVVESCIGLSGANAVVAQVLEGAGRGEWEVFLDAVGIEYLSSVYTILWVLALRSRS